MSYLTYFRNYSEPGALFWDENYHIASAQKYLSGVFFMENHPPLGKMLIALGEKLTGHPQTLPEGISTDYVRTLPPGFSFRGYRFFPALLGWWSAGLVFLIFDLILASGPQAFFATFLYMFDNALIVHQRGAMIESPLLFFTLLMILQFLWILRDGMKGWRLLFAYAAWGVTFGLLMSTKVIGLVMILLPCAYTVRLLPNKNKIVRFWGLFMVSACLPYILIWQIHFQRGAAISPSLSDQGWYKASENYKTWVKDGDIGLRHFPTMLRDSYRFSVIYNRGVPLLDLCKQGENGSPFFYWPFGARAINYRWETPDGKSYRYLYLQCNPLIWACGLVGIVLAFVVIAAPFFFPFAQPPKEKFLLYSFFGLYAVYMAFMSQITRVMYLYHYFMPLLFSFILFGLMAKEIQQIGPVRLTPTRKASGWAMLGGMIFIVFWMYRPFTYYLPMTDAQVERLSLLSVWDLHPVQGNRHPNYFFPCHRS